MKFGCIENNGEHWENAIGHNANWVNRLKENAMNFRSDYNTKPWESDRLCRSANQPTSVEMKQLLVLGVSAIVLWGITSATVSIWQLVVLAAACWFVWTLFTSTEMDGDQQ